MKDVNLMTNQELEHTSMAREIEWMWSIYHASVEKQEYAKADDLYERIGDLMDEFILIHGKPYVKSEWYS